MPVSLFDDRFAPITSEVEFLECDAKTVADSFEEWQRPLQLIRGVTLSRIEVNGSLPEKLMKLLPLTSHEARRILIVPTTGKWTAYFENGWQGNDVSAVSHLSGLIGCRAVRAVSIPNTIRKSPSGERGRFGATILEVFSADPDQCSFLNVQRSVFAANDGGRWKFGASGKPLDFEQPAVYKARQIRDRFTPELLDEYLKQLGIHFFSPAFYEGAQPSYLIAKEGPCATGMMEYSLSKVQETY